MIWSCNIVKIYLLPLRPCFWLVLASVTDGCPVVGEAEIKSGLKITANHFSTKLRLFSHLSV